MSATVKNTPALRALMVRAYAHSMMEDLLSDCAVAGIEPPKSVEDREDYGIRFEETTLQHNAPQWSVGCANNDEERKEPNAFFAEARALVNRWLAEYPA